MQFVALYLFAIIAANLLVAAFGPAVVIVNSLLLVSLDLTTRDALHERWRGRWQPMVALIATGSILSAVLSISALPVAIASFCAFALAGIADTFVYSRLRGWEWMMRSNGSNVVSALVDSLVFLSLLAAFGVVPWTIVPLLAMGQWLAKTLGGLVWAWVFAGQATRE